MPRPKLMASKHELEIIRKLSGRRTQRAIAGFLGRSRNFVQEWQRRLEVLRWRKLDARAEREIVELYRSGKGQVKVAKILRIQQRIVHAVVLKHALLRKTGGIHFQMPPAQFRQFRKDVLSRRYFCVDLAKKYSLTRHTSLKLAKQILGVSTFLRGAQLPPLSSVFPERPAAGYMERGAVCELLSKIFPAGLPGCNDYVLVSAVIDLLCETFPFWRSASMPVLENLENHLVAAVATLRGAEQTSLVN